MSDAITPAPVEQDTLGRRTFLSGASATVLLLGLGSGTLVACTSSGDSTDNGTGGGGGEATGLSFFVWVGSGQGDMPRAVIADYTADHPEVTVEYVEGNNAEVMTQILTSLEVTPDEPLVNLGFFNAAAIETGKLEDIWLPLNPAQVPNIESVRPEYRIPDDKGVYFATSTVGLVYNSKVFEEKGWAPPTSWNDLWDPKFRGKVAVFDEPGFSWNGLLATALVNGGSEENIDPAIDIYRQAAKDGQFHSFFTSPDQLKQLLVNEEAWIAPYFFGLAWTWTLDGAPVGYAVPSEGQIAFPLGFGMVTGSSENQQQHSLAIINEMLTPEMVKMFCEASFAVPVVEGVQVKDELLSAEPYQEEAVANMMNLDWATMAAKNDEYVQKWNEQVKANLK